MKQYQIEISKNFAGLDILHDGEDIDRTWENIKENVKTSAKDSPGVYDWSSIKHGLMNNFCIF